MIPLQFGRAARPLYGVYHPAAGPGRATRGIVLCNPLGQEAVRANRPYRVLAEQLARQRWHVLRFDYSSTGDSAGVDADARIADWLDDIGAAIDELEAIAALRSVHLLGLRLGAALAARVASARPDVDGLVFWDPVASGRRHLEALLPTWRPEHAGDIAGEAHGFVISSALARDVAELSLSPAKPGTPVLLVATRQAGDQAELRDTLERESARVTYHAVEGSLPWTRDNDFGAGPLPVAALKTITDWRGEASR